MLILDAPKLTIFQRCARRHVLERSWKPSRWHPKTLFDACLRRAILDLSSGKPKEKVADGAVARFMETAANPGLDTVTDPYVLAKDFTAMLRTILEALSRLTLLAVKMGPTVELSPDLSWRVSAFQDESGLLHRWQTVERADADTLARELHSWHVFGDMAAAQVPMALHLIEVGTQRKGRRHTAWCRCYKHPSLMGYFKFRSKYGAKLQGGWKPVWYADSTTQDPKTWVDLMESDRLSLIHHVDVKQLSEEHIEQFRQEVAFEAKRMAELPHWQDVPRFRPACDWPTVCPFQPVCYSSGVMKIEHLGGFQAIKKSV